MKLIHHLPQTIAALYKGKDIVWQMLAVALTWAIVASGLDWAYFVSTRGIPVGAIFPAVALGAILPILLPLAVLAFGAMRKSARTIMTGWALGQAAIVGSFISSLYKAFTGRIPPPETFQGLLGVAGGTGNIATTLTDASHGFQFGLFRGGIFWGWPSSHTTIAFAMGAALFALYPDKKIARWIGLVWALYVGLSVSVSIHWLSEFVAGAIIGSVIGIAVGKNFLALQPIKI